MGAAGAARSVPPERPASGEPRLAEPLASGESHPTEPSTPGAPLPPEGLYVHVPFCVSLCPYCDFVVMAGASARGPRNRIAELLEAELRELDLRADVLAAQDGGVPGGGAPAPLRSVYIGGGTPSLLSPAQVGRLMARVDDRLGLAPGAEVTLEANPGPDEIGDLVGFRAAGVERLSIGAQSLADGELRRLGRRHRAADVVAAVAAARAAGLHVVSLDLLTDIPGQTMTSWRRTLEMALDLGPEHLSVYTLTLDRGDTDDLTGAEGEHLPLTAGARAWRMRARAGQSEERAADMESLTDELAAAAGLARYEIANLARPGFESRHNLLYWRRRPYLAIGPGAHASDGSLVRSWNAARLDGYLAALTAGRLPPGGIDVVDPDTALAEEAILGLRLMEGIDAHLAARPEFAAGLAWARDHGLIEDVGKRTRLSQPGRLLANEVFARLLPDPPPRKRTLSPAPTTRSSAPAGASA